MAISKCAIWAILLPLLSGTVVLGAETCFYCRGISCQRSSYQATEQCVDELDACASVFEGGVVRAQGCLESLEQSWRQQCQQMGNSIMECHICAEKNCNNVGPSGASCLQCAEREDARCRSAPEQLEAKVCPIARSGRSFCYVGVFNQGLERGCAKSLAEQQSCLNTNSCQLCDPLQLTHCNAQRWDESVETTPPPTSTTTFSPTLATSTSSSVAPTSPPTTVTPSTIAPTTVPPTESTPTPSTPTPTPPSGNGAESLSTLNLMLLLVLAHLAVFLCPL